MSEEKFKLPGSSYEELTKIIKGYGHLTKPASLDEVSKLTGLHTTIVSRNAGFLIEIGVLDTGAKKSITEPGRSLARALEHEMPDEIERGWRSRVEATEFLTKLLTSIRIRKGMTEETLASHIAYSAGQPKKAGQMTGSRTVIDILRAAGSIKAADGKIVSTEGATLAEAPQSQPTEKKDPRPLLESVEDTQLPTAQVSTVTSTAIQHDQATVRINIDLKIECKSEDLDTLGPKLRRLLATISKSTHTTEPNS